MNIHKDSHVDHGLSERQLSYILERFGDHRAPFKTTIELPEQYGTVPCGLVGPLAGDPPVDESRVIREVRGTRAWKSRLLAVDAAPSSRMVTVIAGEHDGQPCVLFTAYGGPMAPREPADIRQELEELHRKRGALPDRSPENAEHAALYARIVELRQARDESDAFWRDHALIKLPG